MKDELGGGSKGAAGQAAAVQQRRAAMPETAAAIDLWRAAYGVELVDKLLVTAQQARREYTQVLAQQGALAAKRWHKANAHRCTFYACEGGRTVGMPSPYGHSV